MAKTPPMGLRNAILSGEIDEVEKVLRNGANIDADIDDVAPLTFAIQNGEEDIAIRLIQAGANLSLDPIPSVSEESNSTTNGRLYVLNITIFLIVWFENSLWDAACASILASKVWPSLLGSILNSVSAQTLFGFTMRLHVINICSALIWGDLSASLWLCARFMPRYALMFLWTLTQKAFRIGFNGWTMAAVSALFSSRQMDTAIFSVFTCSRSIVRMRQSNLFAVSRRARQSENCMRRGKSGNGSYLELSRQQS